MTKLFTWALAVLHLGHLLYQLLRNECSFLNEGSKHDLLDKGEKKLVIGHWTINVRSEETEFKDTNDLFPQNFGK